MKVVCFVGPSGVGKTTLMTGVIEGLRSRGQRVSVVKHAHEHFDIDRPGKDSHRHREAGAFEVVIASRHRLAKMREFETETQMNVHQLLAELSDCDWALVEGFKHADLPKVELRRPAHREEALLYPDDPFVFAVATDAPLPLPTLRPVFGLDRPEAIVAWLLEQHERFDYQPARHGH